MDRIPTYIDTTTQKISEIAVGDGLDITGGDVKAGTFTETLAPVEYNGTNATADLSKANNFSMDFSAGDSYAFGFAGAPTDAGDAYGCTLFLDTTGGVAMTWNANISWSGGIAPTLISGTVNVFTFVTTDGGTSFKGFVGGQAFA